MIFYLYLDMKCTLKQLWATKYKKLSTLELTTAFMIQVVGLKFLQNFVKLL